MQMARQFGMRLVPMTYVLNREGRIVGAGYGPVDLASPEFAQLREAVRSAAWGGTGDKRRHRRKARCQLRWATGWAVRL